MTSVIRKLLANSSKWVGMEGRKRKFRDLVYLVEDTTFTLHLTLARLMKKDGIVLVCNI